MEALSRWRRHRRMLWIAVSLVVVVAGAIVAAIFSGAGGRRLARGDWEPAWRSDARELVKLSAELDKAVDELRRIVAESSSDPREVPAPALRAKAVGAWCRFADTAVAIQHRTSFHRDFLLLLGEGRRPDRIRGFLFCDAADLAVQDAALALTEAVAANPKWQRILDEPRPDFGLSPGSFERVRDEIHNTERFARQYAALGMLEVYRALPEFTVAAEDDDAAALLSMTERLHDSVRERYRRKGAEFTARQTKDLASSLAFRAWFPVQKNVANAMGNVKVKRRGEYLIGPDLIRAMRERLQPGDVGVTRKNWYLSNCGIPGFWPHAIMHLGTPGEMEAFFDDPEVREWCAAKDPRASSLAELLQRRHPKAWASYARTVGVEEAHAEGMHVGSLEAGAVLRPTFVEAIAPGVVFRCAEETVAADYAGFLRPRLSKVEIARAIDCVFSHAGKPYDYNFDFTTDNELVCSELVYKAYEPDGERRGLAIPLEETLGRPLLSPTTLVRMFDEQHGSEERLFDFAGFIDASEKGGAAVEGSEEAFRASWKRPKWSASLE